MGLKTNFILTLDKDMVVGKVDQQLFEKLNRLLQG